MAEQLAMSMPTKIIDKAVCSWGEGRAYQEIVFDSYWSKRIVLKLFGVYAAIIFKALVYWDFSGVDCRLGFPVAKTSNNICNLATQLLRDIYLPDSHLDRKQ